MTQQTTVTADDSATNVKIAAMAARIRHLETELHLLRTEVRHILAREPERSESANGTSHRTSSLPETAAWTSPGVEDLAYLQTLSEDELVPVHMLTDEDLRNRLEELEREYGIDSKDFYQRWKIGDADEIPDKTAWVILYETVLHKNATETEGLEVVK